MQDFSQAFVQAFSLIWQADATLVGIIALSLALNPALAGRTQRKPLASWRALGIVPVAGGALAQQALGHVQLGLHGAHHAGKLAARGGGGRGGA